MENTTHTDLDLRHERRHIVNDIMSTSNFAPLNKKDLGK